MTRPTIPVADLWSLADDDESDRSDLGRHVDVDGKEELVPRGSSVT